MRIICEDWQAALSYFLNPRVIEKMAKLGLRVERMAWFEKAVYLKADEGVDVDAYLSSLAEISSSDTKCTPLPKQGAVKTTVPSPSLAALR